MIYGSYLKREVSIARTAIVISIADTLIALVAGLAIFPIVFEYGLDPKEGPALIFKTLPIAFGAMPYGQLMGALFFILLVFAAWTSAISLVEPAVTWAIEKLHTTRIKATVWVGIIIWLMGIVSVFSVSGTTIGDIVKSVASTFHVAGLDLRHRFFDLTAFSLIDALVTLILLPLGGLLIAFFAGWVMRRESSEDELSLKSPVSYKFWRYLVRYITPIAVLTIFIFGVLHWVVENLMTQPTII
jgi:NSS family neurotransmitter:Na+ symporter